MKRETVKDSTRKQELESLKVRADSMSMYLLQFFGIYFLHLLSYVTGFTGIDSKYEPPLKPDLVLKSGEWSADRCIDEVIKMLREHVRRNGHKGL